MDKNQIEELLVWAIRKLLEEDSDLMRNDVNERSITHKLAEYLQARLAIYVPEEESFKVDCEYNRKGDLPKRLIGLITQIQSDDTKGETVYPDIIIHKRGEGQGNNLLVIEAKKFSNCNQQSKKRDIEKLLEYKEQLGYKYAYFIEFSNSGRVSDIASMFSAI